MRRKPSFSFPLTFLRIPVANHALRDGALTTNLERTPQTDPMSFQNPRKSCCNLPAPQVLNSLLDICLSRNWLTPSLAGVQPRAHLTRAVPHHSKTIKELDKDYLKFSLLPGLALGEVEKFKNAYGFNGLVQSLESLNDSRAGDAKKVVRNWGNVQIVGCTAKGQFSCVKPPSSRLTRYGRSHRGKDRDSCRLSTSSSNCVSYKASPRRMDRLP